MSDAAALLLIALVAFCGVIGTMVYLLCGGSSAAEVSEPWPEEVLKIEAGPDRDRIITVLMADGSQSLFCGYISCWHRYPDGRRAGSRMEGKLADLVEGFKYREFEKKRSG